MLDTLQIIFWSVTYVLIIIAGSQSRKIRKNSMPYIAGVLIFAWEICALYNSKGFWGHIMWFSLDLAIVYFSFKYIKTKKSKIIYTLSIFISTILLMYIFTLSYGMLFSSFIIDFIMAVCFLADRERLSPKLKVPIAVTKLLGDTFAGLYYAPESVLVAILSGVVFLCNILYLYLCVKETKKTSHNKNKKKKSQKRR